MDAFVSNLPSPPWEHIAASYLRYSCDNSNPRSLDQQLGLQLERAKQNGHFIPWEYVFADAAVSGMTRHRIGYQLAQVALETTNANITVLYIDEIGRASRDAIEALRLGKRIQELNKRLIGISDGFDTNSTMSKMMLMLFAMLQEWFIDQLRAKVNRGMDDAFDQGTNTGLQPLGYKLVPAIDGRGKPQFGKDGERLKMLEIEPEAAKYVLLAFELYLKKWSLADIGRHFNELKVGGQTWDRSRISQVLKRHTYVGIMVYRMRYQKRDEHGVLKTYKRPRKDWKVRRARLLQIVPWKIWKETQQRLERVRVAYAAKRVNGNTGRTDVYPKTLVRPVCGDCGSKLHLGQSGKYAAFKCPNGSEKKHDCKFRGYKSARIIDDAVLSHITSNVLTEERFARLVEQANTALADEAAKPKEDISAAVEEIKKRTAKKARLAKILEKEGAENLDAVVDAIRRHERHLQKLRKRVREAESKNTVPPPITADDARLLLQDLRGLLMQDVPQAAPILEELTGPVVAVQEMEPGKKKPTWFLKFSVDLVPVLAKLAKEKDYQSRSSLEYLNTRSLIMPESVAISLGNGSKSQPLAAKIMAMVETHSRETCAAALGVSVETVNNAVKIASGKPPRKRKKRRQSKPSAARKPVIYRKISKEVARRRDRWRHSFARIKRDLGYSRSVISRAYDHARPEIIQAAIASGDPPNRGSRSRLGKARKAKILAMLQRGIRICDIMREVGCSRKTVQRVKKSMRG